MDDFPFPSSFYRELEYIGMIYTAFQSGVHPCDGGMLFTVLSELFGGGSTLDG
jgi:hypothetical protein